MSKKITDEKLNVQMSINGVNKTQAEISKVQTSIRSLEDANKDLAAAKRKEELASGRQSEKYKELHKRQKENTVEIDKYKAKQKGLQKQLGLTGMTMKQLVQQQRSLKAQMNNFVPGTPEWQKLNRELQETDRRLDNVRGEMTRTEGVMGKMKKSLGGFGAMFLGGAGLMAAWQGMKKLVKVNAELSDSQANVRKTTGLTNDEVSKLTKNLKEFDTRTPVKELLALAEEAGRLGKDSVEDIEKFVLTADKISVALGDDLQGDINENVQLIGKLATQYKVGEKYGGDFGKTMERIGSAINEVAASGANQAGFLVDYMKRLSGVSSQTGISADQQLGFAAALDEAGQSVETSGTTMSKIIVDMYKDADNYAKIAGVSTEEFSDLLKTDANEALLLFLEGLKGNNEGFEVMAQKMKGLKLEGARSVAVLSSLAANTDNVRAKQQIANGAIVEATSLTDEFNVKNNNLAGNLEKLGNTISNYFKNSALTGWLTDATGGILNLIGVTKTANEVFAAETKTKFENAVANRKIAESSADLLEEYESLTKDGVEPTEEAKQSLDIITLQLKDHLGDSVVAIDKETGALKLNTDAVREQITLKRLAADEEASTMVSRLKGVKTTTEELEKQRKRMEKELSDRESMISDKDRATETSIKYAPAGFKEEELPKSIEQRNEAARKLREINKDLLDQEQRRLDLVTKLENINFSEDDADAFFKTNTPDSDAGEGGNGDEEAGDTDLAARDKRYRALLTLQERYAKMEQDRLAVSNEEKAVLERDRAVQQAEELRASQTLLNDIKEEHQVKIDEAREKDEEIKLQNIQAFEDRKRELENQIALQNEHDDEERAKLAEQLKYEKDQELLEKELEKIQANEEQKHALRELLKEEHEASMAEIEARYGAIRVEKEKELNNESVKATEQLEDAKARATQGGLSIMASFFDKKSGIYKALFLMEKGAALAEVGNHAAKALAEITANTAAANAKAVSASPLTFGMPWVGVNTALGVKQAASVKLNTALQMATIGASAIQGVAGFEDGLYRDVVRTDGKRFTARNMGRSGTQIVNEPSYFSNNGGFLAAEAGPEMIIDNDVFRRLDPRIVQNILDVRHNVKGFETGMYPESNGGSSDAELKAMIAGMMNLLQNPPSPTILWGYGEVEKNNELQTEIEQSKQNGNLTP